MKEKKNGMHKLRNEMSENKWKTGPSFIATLLLLFCGKMNSLAIFFNLLDEDVNLALQKLFVLFPSIYTIKGEVGTDQAYFQLECTLLFKMNRLCTSHKTIVELHAA